MTAIELTGFAKSGGPLTKRISLLPDGSVHSDGSACKMACGTAQRLRVADIGELAAVVGKLKPHEAIALGTLRKDLPDQVQVVTKVKLNGQPNAIARTADNILFRKQQPALALLDFDVKSMPPEVEIEIKRLGGFWPTMQKMMPALRSVAHVIRRSTSAGLFRTDTGERLPRSSGLHVYIPVRDGSDIERFLRTLHEQCWLAGFGWMMVGSGGQFLDRSAADRMVGAPERLVFEGNPILDPPLAQDSERRRPLSFDGDALDTLTVCPPLSIVETAKLRELKAKEKHRLAAESAKVRAAFVKTQAQRLAARTGMSEAAAATEVARQCEGVLRPDVELPFDDEEFAGCTVGDVLADPEKFEGATLADPLEGVAYGVGKAKIMRRKDSTLWIHSFAHGRTVYELKHNLSSASAAMTAAADKNAVEIFLQMALTGDLGLDEIERLRNDAARRAGMSKRTLAQMLRAAQDKDADKRRQEQWARRMAERNDPRPTIRRPDEDTPWLPQMALLNDVIGAVIDLHPPTRNIDSDTTYISRIAIPSTHAFTSSDANPEEDK